MKFKADELKKRIDLLVDAGVEVIQIDEGYAQRCFIDGYSPHIPSEYDPMMIIMEEE